MSDSVRSRKSSTKSNSSTAESSPKDIRSKLRAPDNTNSPLLSRERRSTSQPSLSFLSQALESAAAPQTPSKETRNRKRSFRLSSTGDSPNRLVRSIKRVSSAFKSSNSSGAVSVTSESDNESKRSESPSTVSARRSFSESIQNPFIPPRIPKAAASPTPRPGTSPEPVQADPNAASSFVVPISSPHQSEPASGALRSFPLQSPTTPLATGQPITSTPTHNMSASGVAPASVGFPEVDQIGDQLDSSFPTVWEASHEEAQTEKPEVLASMDYPPVEKLLASQAAEEKAIQVTSSSSSGSEDGADVDHDGESSGPPAHSLTASAFRAIFNPRKYNMSVSTRRKVYLVLGSLAINLLLPFINGVMLGLGEIFARETVAIYFGLGPKASAAKSGPQPARANVGSVGLRAAGESGAGNPKPGKAGAKTAAEVAEDAARRL